MVDGRVSIEPTRARCCGPWSGTLPTPFISHQNTPSGNQLPTGFYADCVVGRISFEGAILDASLQKKDAPVTGAGWVRALTGLVFMYVRRGEASPN